MRRLLFVWLCVNTPSVLNKSRLTRSSKGKTHMKSNTLVRSMALAAALALRDMGEHALGFMLLIYGVYSTDTESASWQRRIFAPRLAGPCCSRTKSS